MTQRPTPPLGVILKPSLFKLELKSNQSGSLLQLSNEPLRFHAVVQTCGDKGRGSVEPVNGWPVVTGIGTLNEDLSEAKYFRIVQEPAKTKHERVQFELRFEGDLLSKALNELCKKGPEKQPTRSLPAYQLFKALVQRERIFVELHFGQTARVLAIDPSVLIVSKD